LPSTRYFIYSCHKLSFAHKSGRPNSFFRTLFCWRFLQAFCSLSADPTFLFPAYICCKAFRITNLSSILSQPIEYLKGVGPLRADLLKKELGVFTYQDLLYLFPYRHIDKTSITKIEDLNSLTDYAQVQGKLWYFETAGAGSSKG
jgi:hypothetical protein